MLMLTPRCCAVAITMHEALIVGINRGIIVYTLEVVELSQTAVEENIEPVVEVFVLFET